MEKEVILSLKNVHKVFPPYIKALDGVSFEVRKGEFLFLTGPSGAGKSTLLNIIFGLDEPTSGEVYFYETSYDGLDRKKLAHLRRRMGFVFQDFKLLNDKSVYENVYLGLEILGIPERIARDRIFEVLSALRLSGRSHLPVKVLSGGEKQRVAIARAIVRSPELLLADEPTGNLDPATGREILRLIEELNLKGITVIFATHDESLYRNTRHRVITLEGGKVISDIPGKGLSRV